MKVEVRYATNPQDFKSYETERLRKDFLDRRNFYSRRDINGIFDVRSLYGRRSNACKEKADA